MLLSLMGCAILKSHTNVCVLLPMVLAEGYFQFKLFYVSIFSHLLYLL